MKSLNIAFFMMSTIALANAGSSKGRFHGEISDTQCALNVHSLERSHAEMIAKGTLGTNAASCANACVRRGGEWVLRSGDDVYRLKNQSGMEQYAGEKVEVTGTLERKTSTIDNTDIEVVQANRHTPH